MLTSKRYKTIARASGRSWILSTQRLPVSPPERAGKDKRVRTVALGRAAATKAMAADLTAVAPLP